MADSYVCSGAMMKCTMGTCPARLTVLPTRTVFLTGQPMANISDHQTMVNLAPFGLCRSMGFPATASATAAAMGTLTPMPCMHNTPFPWMGGKMDYLVKGQPALLKTSKCQCLWGGAISIIDDGQHGEGTQWVQKTPEANQKHADKLILLDAYWEKDGMKIRFIPHQTEVTLVVVFKFMYNDDAKYDKCKAVFELTFDSPSTIFSQKNPIIIKGNDVIKNPLLNKYNEVVKDNDQPCYYYKIDKFSPDFSNISF